MVLLFYSQGMGVERGTHFRFFDLVREYLKGNEKNEWYHAKPQIRYFCLRNGDRDVPLPIKGTSTIIKGGMQGDKAGWQ
jgi:hypothetical protein